MFLILYYLIKLKYKNSNMKTFIELYNFLQTYNEISIAPWIKNRWEGKDKQESLLRLFASLGLINKLNKYEVLKGNFNAKTIKKTTTNKEIFYNNESEIMLNDKGDASDLTCISKSNDKHLLLTTSKNLNKLLVGKLDIDKILTNFQKYKDNGYTMSLCICIRDIQQYTEMKDNIEATNNDLKGLLDKDDTIIIDWSDLDEAYHAFKLTFNTIELNNLIKIDKQMLIPKMHQEYATKKIFMLKSNGANQILLGHIQRSGKSYIIGYTIIEDCKDKDECNYLIITTAPNETIKQLQNICDCAQLSDFNVIVLNGKNKKPVLGDKNIIICSKQFLDNKNDNVKATKTDKLRVIKQYLKKDKIKTKRLYTDEEVTELISKYNITTDEIITNKPISTIKWLKDMKFNMRFIDESHNGGTTELAKKSLDTYGSNAFTVQITATYSKPVNDYNISKEKWVLWDLEDIKLCKTIELKDNYNRLIEKHGCSFKDIIDKYSVENIKKEYAKYPDLWILTDKLTDNVVDDIIKNTKDNNYGWSTESAFLLKQCVKTDKETGQKNIVVKDEFQNEEENLKIWYRIFGKTNSLAIPDKDYPDDKVFMKRIETICNNPDTESRFMRKGDFINEPMIIMAFLPQNNINNISKATEKLLVKNNVIPDYHIVSINSKTTNDPKKTIEEARIKARNSGKKGVLVLSGRQCSLGVSIENCDIVLLLNNNMGFDLIYQMMFRCMTEGKNKKMAFVIDLNIQRVIETSIINYATTIKPDIHPKEATKYILQSRLINLNGDHWIPSFGKNESNITTLCDNIYNLYSSNITNVLGSLFERLKFKEVLFTNDEQKMFNILFTFSKDRKQTQRLKDYIDKVEEEADQIKKGVEKVNIESSTNTSDLSSNTDSEDDNYDDADEETKEEKVNYMDILKHIIPLVCILTIHNDETSFVEMYKLIEQDKYIYTILIDQTKNWWGKHINGNIIAKLIYIYIKYMLEDKETETIIRTVKELFVKNLNNYNELSKAIDTYLIPKELEKKNNAEVSTPYKLRQEMLDKIPEGFWTTPKKVFEPCAGKGGFVIDIIDRFMNGLKDTIPDENERHKTIVENCLYFSDINPTNIFICKLLVDPYNQYKLNYNEGNTLELDIKEKWGIDGFDAVIGNPPYQKSSSNKGVGNTLWDLFVKKSLNEWLIEQGYLSYVHPQGWRQLDNKTGLLLLSKQILYLNMNDVNQGIKTFNCSTTFDYYVLQNCPIYKNTTIVDYKNKKIEYNLKNCRYIPNHSINIIEKYIDFENINGLIKDRSKYGTERKWIQKLKTEDYKYPCIYSINSKNELSLRWSNINNNGHFGETKYIVSNGNGYYKDINGDYGCTEWSYYIKCNPEDMDDIYKCFQNKEFLNLIDAVKLTSNKYNYVILKHLKKNFWMDFI
jgi:hypothetical protein